MVKNDKGNILCRNHRGKEHYLSPLYVANQAMMEKYGWVVVEEPQSPPVNIEEIISETIQPEVVPIVAELGEEVPAPTTTKRISPVFAVNLKWEILSHESDLSQVMKPEDCRFIGTEDECTVFIKQNKPKRSRLAA